MVRLVLAAVLVTGLAVLPVSAKQYVAIPNVEWEALIPYVRANIVAQLDGTEFHVFVCEGQTDRSVQSPFDDALGDFAKVLLMQSMRDNPKLVGGIEAAVEGFRTRLWTLSAGDRERYREIFWQALSGSPEVLPRIQSVFAAARQHGRLRCWSCENDPGFAPRAARIVAGRRRTD